MIGDPLGLTIIIIIIIVVIIILIIIWKGNKKQLSKKPSHIIFFKLHLSGYLLQGGMHTCMVVRRQSAVLSFPQVSPKLNVRPVASAFTQWPISLAKTTLKPFLQLVYFKSAILCQNHKQTILMIHTVWGSSSVARVFAQHSWSSGVSLQQCVKLSMEVCWQAFLSCQPVPK